MEQLLAILALGFVLGMKHATDPDHVLAVATIVARHRDVRDAARIGAWWGLGHTVTIVTVGGGIIVFSWAIPPRVGLSMEFSVGLMLILLGAMTLLRVRRRTHVHDTRPVGGVGRDPRGAEAQGIARPLLVGIVHGLAGSAAVALLVLAAISTPSWSLVYLLVFGAGTIAGMMMVTAAIALPFTQAGSRTPALTRGLGIASGLAALGFGCLLAYHVGFTDGLFTATPRWTPR